MNNPVATNVLPPGWTQHYSYMYDRPFYLNIWHYGVHGPWGHKEKYTEKFAEKKDPRDEQRNPIMASMLKSVDESLGRILAKLDELGLTRKTIFIFYSDNGGNVHSNIPSDRRIANIKPGHPRYPMVADWKKWAGPEAPTNNAPLREGKARIYEGGQRVPLMVRWPGRIKPGSTSDAVVAAIDLYPTLLDALDLPKPKNHLVDGESILPVLEGTSGLQRKAYFTWFPHLVGAASVRQGDYKLIRRFEPHPKYPELIELYDLEKDIGETRNLAGKMPEKVKELQALIDGFVKETGALHPRPNPNYNPDKKPAASKPKSNRPSPEEFLRRRDKNKDGSITLEEFIGDPRNRDVPALKKQFSRRDRNGDGNLTLDELKNTRRK